MKLLDKAAFIALLALVALSGCIQNSSGWPSDSNADGNFGTADQAGTGIDRNSYGEGWFFNANSPPTKGPIQNAFLELPIPPKDFKQKVNALIQSTNFFEFSKKGLELEEEYYVQPEFLPNFSEIGLQYWKNPDLNHWGVYGFGFYPSDEEFNLKRGEEVTAVTFYHSGWYVQTFQGARLEASFPEDQLEVKIEPENVLLEPSYPTVSRGWIRKIAIKIRAKAGAPPGNYEIGINPVAPDANAEAEWNSSFAGKYRPVSSQNSLGRDRFRIKVMIE